jgi:hypothetical protein
MLMVAQRGLWPQPNQHLPQPATALAVIDSEVNLQSERFDVTC